MVLDEDTCNAIIGAVIRQARKDYEDGYTHPNVRDAGDFLRSLDLLSEDGVLDRRFVEWKRSYARRRNEVTG